MNASPKIALYSTQKATETAIGAFHTSAQAVQAESHKIACSVLLHFSKHKDKRIVEKMLHMFVQAMPEMARINALKAWFEHYGPVKFDGKSVLYVAGKATKLGEAMNTPFWKFQPEPDYKPVNVSALIESLSKKLAKDATETGRDHSAVIAALALIDPEKPVVIAKVAKPKALKRAISARKAVEAKSAPALN